MSTPAYQKLILYQRPSLYYRFNESSGAVAADTSGNGREGTYVAAPTLGAAGALAYDDDKAVLLDGVAQFITSGYSPFALGSARSFSGWAKRDDSVAADSFFGGNGNPQPLARLDAGGSNFSFFTSSTGASVTWAGAWPANGVYVHWGLRYDDAALLAELFINGISQGVKALASAYAAAPGTLVVGTRGGGANNPWGGSQDEFCAFERLLTPGEFKAQFMAGAPSVPALDPTFSPPVRVVSINPVTGGTYELSGLIEGLNYSNVDPGGDEAASFLYRKSWTGSIPELEKGNLLRITAGLDVVWQGRIEEADRSADQTETINVTAYGLGVRLKDNTMREIYADRDLSRWNGASVARKLVVHSVLSRNPLDPAVNVDVTGAAPALELTLVGAWGQAQYLEAQYDAGPGLTAAYVYFNPVATSTVALGDANWSLLAYSMTDDGLTAYEQSAEAKNGPAQYWTPATPRRWMEFAWWYGADVAGTEGMNYTMFLRGLTVYGSHGLTRRGSDPGGFGPDQIVGNVVGRVNGLTLRRLDAQSYVIPHFIVTDPTIHQDVITAASSFVTVNWGTWGPTSALDNSLSGYFDYKTQDRATQHWFAYRSQADAIDLHSEMATLYNRVDVTFTDASGVPSVTTRTAYVQELDSKGITRTASIDAGNSTLPVAQTLGDTFLGLFGGFGPARGSVAFKRPISHYQRGLLSPIYMRADGSNLRLADILPTQTLFGLDSAPDRRATFPIKRVSVDFGGAVPMASCDLDQASDALAALEARLALAAQYYQGVPLPTAAEQAADAEAGDTPGRHRRHHHHHHHGGRGDPKTGGVRPPGHHHGGGGGGGGVQAAAVPAHRRRRHHG